MFSDNILAIAGLIFASGVGGGTLSPLVMLLVNKRQKFKKGRQLALLVSGKLQNRGFTFLADFMNAVATLDFRQMRESLQALFKLVDNDKQFTDHMVEIIEHNATKLLTSSQGKELVLRLAAELRQKDAKIVFTTGVLREAALQSDDLEPHQLAAGVAGGR